MIFQSPFSWDSISGLLGQPSDSVLVQQFLRRAKIDSGELWEEELIQTASITDDVSTDQSICDTGERSKHKTRFASA